MSAINNEERVTAIVSHLSALIGQAVSRMERERHLPSFSPDQMDDAIKFNRDRAAALRRLREEFEDEMARPAP